jgi:TRAP-type C4-dicarboxylate transport system permease small subunit
MNRFVKTVHGLAKYSEALTWAALVVMMALVVFNCISRRLGSPLYGTYDYIGFLLVLIIAPALARCASEKGHIFLSMFTEKFPPKVQFITDLVMDVLNFVFCGILTWALSERTLDNLESGLTGMTSSIPVYPFILIEAIALSLVYLSDIVQTIGKLRSVKIS